MFTLWFWFLIFLGVGNELHQYYLDPSNHTLHRQINLNFRNKIYGISSFDGEHNESDTQFVAVYGGREVAIFLLTLDKHLKLITRLTLSDWISSIKVYKPISSDEVSFCVLTAHSVASEFKVNINGKWRIEHKVSCTDKCTLYCSVIIGNDWAETTIFGGTAFGELIIWNAAGNDSTRDVLQRLSGHNVRECLTRIAGFWTLLNYFSRLFHSNFNLTILGCNFFHQLFGGQQLNHNHIWWSIRKSMEFEIPIGNAWWLECVFDWTDKVDVWTHCTNFQSQNHRTQWKSLYYNCRWR